MNVVILDRTGAPQDWTWLQNKFGNVTYNQSGEEMAHRLVRIQERQGHASHVVSLIDAEGAPISGITVIRYWPGAPVLPPWEPPPERWFNKGVYGETNAEGNIGFGMGHGDLYYPPAPGPSSVWVGELGVGSDCFNGIGWIVAETDLHLDLVFQRLSAPPPPEPPDPNWTLLFEKLDGIYKRQGTANTRLSSLVSGLTTTNALLRRIIELMEQS